VAVGDAGVDAGVDRRPVGRRAAVAAEGPLLSAMALGLRRFEADSKGERPLSEYWMDCYEQRDGGFMVVFTHQKVIGAGGAYVVNAAGTQLVESLGDL
jgi:hypothetical protein